MFTRAIIEILVLLRSVCLPVYKSINESALKLARAIYHNSTNWINWISSWMNPWHNNHVQFNDITVIGNVSSDFEVDKDSVIIKDFDPFFYQRTIEDILFFTAAGAVFFGIFMILKYYYQPKDLSVLEGLQASSEDFVESVCNILFVTLDKSN